MKKYNRRTRNIHKCLALPQLSEVVTNFEFSNCLNRETASFTIRYIRKTERMQPLMTIMHFPKRKMPPTYFQNRGAIRGGGLKEIITRINSTCPHTLPLEQSPMQNR